MYCTNCGKKIERKGAAFCPYCGAQLDPEPDEEAPSAPASPEAEPASTEAEEAAVQAPEPEAEPSAPEPAPEPAPDATMDATQVMADETQVMPDVSMPSAAAAPGNTASFPAQEVVPSPAPDGPAPEEPDPPKKKHGHKALIIALVAILAAGCAGAGIWWKYQEDQKAAAEQAAWDAAHAERAVHLTVVAPNYTSDATRIPLEIKGTDLDGNSVDRTEYIGTDNPDLSLLQGDYTISVVASPILSDGSLYTVPETPVSVTVGEDDEATADQEIDLTPIDDATTVTDDQIAAAKAAASADPEDNGKAETLASAATKKRDDAVAAKKAAEEEAKRQAEEAAKQAALQQKQDERKQLAVAYIKALHTTVQLPLPADDAKLQQRDESEWEADVEQYLNASGLAQFNKGPWGDGKGPAMDAAEIVKDAQVTAQDGDTVTVSYQWAGTNGNKPGWSKETNTASATITFDDNNKISGITYNH